MVEDDALSHKIDHVTIFLWNSNLEGYPNHNTSSRVKAMPIGGDSAVEGLR